VSLARRFGRGWIQRRLHLNGRWARLDAAVAREGPRIIFLSQVHPMFPTSLLNYLYGLTRVPVRVCVLWIALGQVPGMFLYAFLGRGESTWPAGDWELWGVGLLSMFILTIVLARIALRMLAEAGEVEGEDSPSA
jgi:uncharacterized membrane protein YdjX (TVP38/TMEM64 family)